MAMLDLRSRLAPNPSRPLAPDFIAVSPRYVSVLAPRRSWARLAACIAEWKNRARSRSELGTFDERDLADIGQARADAFVEARKPFWKA